MINDIRQQVDDLIVGWTAAHGIELLRVSLGAVFLWFGVLKFFPGASSAEELATDTIQVISFGLVRPDVSIFLLAAWESLIGIGLITGRALRATLLLLFLQLPGTLLPLVLFPDLTFRSVPFVPTLEGQYIIKNLVLASAGLVIAATVRGHGKGRVSSERDQG
jgi:uncharacterized membrane protein YphA (DoxX/SURF4 family)